MYYQSKCTYLYYHIRLDSIYQGIHPLLCHWHWHVDVVPCKSRTPGVKGRRNLHFSSFHLTQVRLIVTLRISRHLSPLDINLSSLSACLVAPRAIYAYRCRHWYQWMNQLARLAFALPLEYEASLSLFDSRIHKQTWSEWEKALLLLLLLWPCIIAIPSAVPCLIEGRARY